MAATENSSRIATGTQPQASASTSAKPRKFFESLESLRGLAALLVVLYHLPPWYQPFFEVGLVRNGHAAVEFFFVLSGFVMYHRYELQRWTAQVFKRFMLLRFLRLYPVHLTFTLIFFAIEFGKSSMGAARGSLGEHSHQFSVLARALVENLLLVQGLGLAPREVFLNFPSWSISTEFYTYLLFGLAAWLCKHGGFLRLATLLTAASCLALVLVGERVGEFQQLLRCVAGFFLGCLTRAAYGRIGQRAASIDWSGVLLLTAFALLSLPRVHDVYIWIAGLPFSAAIVLSLAVDSNSLTNRLLSSRPLRWLGEISYSLYMCHALVIYFARHGVTWLFEKSGLVVDRTMTPSSSWAIALAVYVLALAAIMAGGWVTYAAIEQPAKRWMRMVGREKLKPAIT